MRMWDSQKDIIEKLDGKKAKATTVEVALAPGESIGFLFGWLGVALMFALHEWPARIACPKCGKLRIVTRELCEHCGAAHALPRPDGTEITEPSENGLTAVLTAPLVKTP